MCTFRDSISELNTVGAKVLGISVDSFFALKAWADAEKLNFPLLSDFNKTVISQYDVVNPDMIGLKNISKRAVFVIDRSGVVRHREVLDDARNEPDYAKIKKALAGRVRSCSFGMRKSSSIAGVADILDALPARGWGVWRIPESDLGAQGSSSVDIPANRESRRSAARRTDVAMPPALRTAATSAAVAAQLRRTGPAPPAIVGFALVSCS